MILVVVRKASKKKNKTKTRKPIPSATTRGVGRKKPKSYEDTIKKDEQKGVLKDWRRGR